MRKVLGILFVVVLLCESYSSNAQSEDEILQNLEEVQPKDQDVEILLQVVEKRKNNRINRYNINDIGREEMLLLGLNNFQIFCLENYILRTGNLLSINELRFINGFDSLMVDRISPYLYTAPKNGKLSFRLDSVFKYSHQNFRVQYVQNLKNTYGMLRTDGKGYLGGNFASSFRYSLKYYNKLEFSIVAEKDYGEPLYYRNKIYGYDHYAIVLTIKDLSKHLKQLTIGDFRLNIGEGLAMKQSFAFNYFTNGFGGKHSNNTIAPFRSVSEYDYNRGIALKMQWCNVEMIIFGSYDGLDFNGKSIQKTGYHRTKDEIEKKDSNTLALMGTSVQYYNKGINIGMTTFAYYYKYDILKGTQAYQQYNFEGRDNNILSFNSSYIYKNIIFFTEIVRSRNNAFAELLGMQVDFSYKHNLSFIFRNYDKRYHNHYANAIGYHTNNNNERGIYVDYNCYVNEYSSYFVGIDFYYFPFMSYRADKSSYGWKMKTQACYKPGDNHIIDIYFRMNNHQYNTIIQNTKQLKNNIVSQWQIKYLYKFSGYLTFSTRIGYSHSFTYKNRANYGYFACFETKLQTLSQRISTNMRYTYFHTSDYNNRFYVYEYSLPLSFSSSMLYKTGHKFYVVASCKISKSLKAYLRYTLTCYNNAEEISLGNALVDGNLQHYLGGQLCYEF